MFRLEEENGLRSLIHVYGGQGGLKRTPTQMLIDPGYNLANGDLASRLKAIAKQGWQIGLHPSCNSWDNTAMIQEERQHVESALGNPITACRQHWLRFSWRQTWKAQQKAGLLLDSTMGFNDRPGFRNSAALSFHPWDFAENAPMRLKATPLVLMDSHLYDYAQFSDEDRSSEMNKWIKECSHARGTATVLWHPHTLGRDYGWLGGFKQLLTLLKETQS